MPTRLALILFLVLLFAIPAYAAPHGKSAPQRHRARLAVNDPSIPQHRIFALNKEGAAAPLSFEQLMADLSSADVVICGEYHDDPNSHKMELALLKGYAGTQVRDLKDRGDMNWASAYIDRRFALSMEMFERDVQAPLDGYVFGDPNDAMTEERFLAASRPWPNYKSDYRPLVEFCREHKLLVSAANCPTALARRVAKEGLAAVGNNLSPADLRLIAVKTSAPRDGYSERFKSFMDGGGAGSHGSGMTEDQIYGFYQAQCLKDDTMAESIESIFQYYSGRMHSDACGGYLGPAVHVFQLNGSFHSDFGFGTAQRTRERLPQKRVYTIALRPAPDFKAKSNGGSLDPQGETLVDGTPVADFVIYVPAPPAKSEQSEDSAPNSAKSNSQPGAR